MLTYDLTELPEQELIPGFRGKLVHSGTMTFVYWEIAAGAELPQHAHPHEQVAHTFSGEFELTIEGETRVLTAGSVAVIPGNARHWGRALTDCRIMDAFHPVREDYRQGLALQPRGEVD